ncbi:CD225/dispanin family protein [Rhodococcus tibetensis]|uniref:CD225/dispanin family protein n=1 Tax=Rhodococcus tibetensis TaxID=2965064 RepID=A0ABT1QKQ4_9NOCA|nr:CD225/dispanin family protein [Rhodococcus sp. FXJ9.536]MCQ4122762.1 CD225/dispanin family protein [Rhodococcus sp. FXJ9.536]
MHFWPLVFHPFGDALKMFPRWYIGGLDGAHAASLRARTLGIIGLRLGGV